MSDVAGGVYSASSTATGTEYDLFLLGWTKRWFNETLNLESSFKFFIEDRRVSSKLKENLFSLLTHLLVSNQTL